MAGKVRSLYDGKVGCSADGRATLKEPCTPGPCTCPYGTAGFSVTFSGITVATACGDPGPHSGVVSVTGDVNDTFLLLPREDHPCCFQADTGLPVVQDGFIYTPYDPEEPWAGGEWLPHTINGTIFISLSYTQLEDGLDRRLHRLLMAMNADWYTDIYSEWRCQPWSDTREVWKRFALFDNFSWGPRDYFECGFSETVTSQCPGQPGEDFPLGYGGQAIITPLSAGGIE